MSKGANLAPQEIRMDFAVLPETKSQGLFALHRQPDAQIFTGSGLASAALLVDDGNRGCFL